MVGSITALTSSKDSEKLFLGDRKGWLKLWDIKKQKVIKDFGKIHIFIIFGNRSSNEKL